MKTKKYILAFISFIIVLSTATSAFANTENANIELQINTLSQKYNFTTFDLSNNLKSANGQEYLKFNSIGDFENFVKSCEEPKTLPTEINISKSTGFNSYNDTYNINWYAPFSGWGMTGLACWRNISFNYTYDYVNGNPKFQSVTNIQSNLSGINVTWWSQKAAAPNFATTINTSDTVNIKITGDYVLGVEINGFKIGLVIPDTWNGSLRLTS